MKIALKWEEKFLHGKYPTRVKEADVDCNLTHKWLKSAGLKAETEGLLVAAQDQSLATRSYQHRILNNDVTLCAEYVTASRKPSIILFAAVLNYLDLSTYVDTITLPLTSTGKSAKSTTTSKWQTNGTSIHQKQ